MKGIETWPGFAGLGDQIKLKFKTKNTTIGAVRRRLASAKAVPTKPDESARLPEKVIASDRDEQAARAESERLAEEVRQHSIASDRDEQAARAESERLAEEVRQQKAARDSSAKHLASAQEAAEKHEKVMQETAKRTAEARRQLILGQFSTVRDAVAAASPNDVPAILAGAIQGDSECLGIVAVPHGSLLHSAVRVGASAAAAALLKARAGLAVVVDEDGCLPMHVAARFNCVSMIPMFDATVASQASSFAKQAPLHEAAKHNHVEFIRALLDMGARIDILDANGCTPMHWAAKSNAEAACTLLVERGADLQAKSRDGLSAIDALRAVNCGLADKLVALRHRLASAKLLEAARARWTAEHGALSFGAADAVRCAATVERIRSGAFDPVNDPFVKSAATEAHGRTLLALGLLTHPSTAVSDVSALLSEQEALAAAQSPLFLLAHARMHALRDGASSAVSVSLLGEYVRAAGGDGWLTSAEKALLENVESGALELGAIVAPTPSASTVEQRWALLSKQLTAAQRKPMDELLKLAGLEDVKRVALDVYGSVLADQKLERSGFKGSKARESLNFAFLGNPGTGKTTVARLFAALLEQAGARAGNRFVQMTASQALRKGAATFATEMAALTGSSKSVGPPPRPLRRGANVEVDVGGTRYPGQIVLVGVGKTTYDIKYTDSTVEEGVPEARVRPVGEGQAVGGVLFLDEAYDLDPANDADGRAILAEIMSVAEDHRDTVTIILAGYKADIEHKLYAFNVGLPSRFRSVQFDDFSEAQLGQIWRSMGVEHGWRVGDDVSRVAAARIARGRGRKGFGNARTVRQLFECAIGEAKHRYAGGEPTMVVEDVIGKEPSREHVPELDAVMRELESMVGLGAVKRDMQALVDLARSNYKRELAGLKVDDVPLNRLFLGGPGTGKTTVAALYGRLLRALRFLSNGELVSKTASDFVGRYVGESQQKTAALLEMAKGRVLLIDEAYALDDQMYGKQALDTIVEKVSGAPGEDIAVVMCGYRAEVTKMLRDQNPGLARRFDVNFALQFDDLSDSELYVVFSQLCRDAEVVAPIMVRLHAVGVLAKLKRLPNFGNVAAAKTLFAGATKRMAIRVRDDNVSSRELTTEDVESTAAGNPLRALEQELGGHEMERQLVELGERVRVRQRDGRSTDGLVGNYVFTGAPGTGKTSVARTLGKALFAFGLLAKPDVVETSGAGLIGAFIGHSRKNVEEKMKEARGGVLFIDEAHSLGRGTSYTDEAVDQLVGMLTLPEYAGGKTVVVLAGRGDAMHHMLTSNAGLKSRFAETIHFDDWSPPRCAELVLKTLRGGPAPFVLRDATHGTNVLECAFATLQQRPNWGNARDAVLMASKIVDARDIRVSRLGGDTVPDLAIESVDVEVACERLLVTRPLAPLRPAAVVNAAADSAVGVADSAFAPMCAHAHTHSTKTNAVEASDGDEFASTVDELENVDIDAADDDERVKLFAQLQANADAIQHKLESLVGAERSAAEYEMGRIRALCRKLQAMWESGDVDAADAQLHHEQKRQLMIAKLSSLSTCPLGFAWKYEKRGFRCSAGGHTISFQAAGIPSEEAREYFET